ncbi:MAG: hemolysin family protein [Terrimicrobiaceae bacterium]|nr:hemolysin family protein [Terrimicrobiaceae bacterium]
MSPWLAALLSLGFLLAFASATFSAVETAIFSMSEERRRKLRVRDPRRADMLDALMKRPDELANTLSLANTLTNLPLLILLLALLDPLGVSGSPSGWDLLALGFAAIVVLCELLPKLLALAAPIRTTRWSLPFVRRLLPALEPVTALLQRLSEGIVRRVVPRTVAPFSHLTDDELETLVEIGREEGTFDETESRLLREVMKLRGEAARHCMTPRIDAFTLPDDLTNAEAAVSVQRKRYRFVPVRGETPDDILGLLDAKEFLLHPSASHYTERLQPPSFVPETIKALDLLRAFLGHRQHLAILLDEYGGIEGLVTLSDLVEELLGEEGPDASSELYIERLGTARLLAAGSARLDDIEEQTGIEFAGKDLQTVGGLVVEHFGSLPRPGESFILDGWRFTVRRATRKRVREVLIELAGPEVGARGEGI